PRPSRSENGFTRPDPFRGPSSEFRAGHPGRAPRHRSELRGATFATNEASRRLPRRCGFREVGRRERIARLRGEWRDTILSERRSAVVGAG
ncbi:MAG TPA: hypothetical protein VH092_13660, partial [Urbifossiella sp.]|nr:hypothetical protein [Urbifossiella sp.]